MHKIIIVDLIQLRKGYVIKMHFAYVMQENDRTDEQTQIENRPIGSFVAFEPGLQFIFHMYN